MRCGSGERGQATVEWVGLLLGVALAFGALVGGVRGAAKEESATGLGEALAQRITCAARDGCAAGGGERAVGGGVRGGRRSGVRREGHGERHAGRSPRSSRAAAAPTMARGADAAQHAWIVCFAYRRWRYDVEGRRTPYQAVPVRETVRIVNDCLNPWSFFFG